MYITRAYLYVTKGIIVFCGELWIICRNDLLTVEIYPDSVKIRQTVLPTALNTNIIDLQSAFENALGEPRLADRTGQFITTITITSGV